MINRNNWIQLLDIESDRILMMEYMHKDGIISADGLMRRGIRLITIRKFHRQERAKYIRAATQLYSVPKQRKPKRLNLKAKQRLESHLRECEKLERAIRERAACKQSVTDYFFHRGEKIEVRE
jgi:hypothetical protein